jgi:hypothetical protein
MIIRTVPPPPYPKNQIHITTSPSPNCYTPPVHLVTLVLAAARLTTLITRDEITAPLRSKVESAPPNSLIQRFKLDYLTSCPQCVSIHAAAATLLAARIPPLRPLLKILALSQLALALLDAQEILSNRAAQPAQQLDLTLDPPEPPEPPEPQLHL